MFRISNAFLKFMFLSSLEVTKILISLVCRNPPPQNVSLGRRIEFCVWVFLAVVLVICIKVAHVSFFERRKEKKKKKKDISKTAFHLLNMDFSKSQGISSVAWLKNTVVQKVDKRMCWWWYLQVCAVTNPPIKCSGSLYGIQQDAPGGRRCDWATYT